MEKIIRSRTVDEQSRRVFTPKKKEYQKQSLVILQDPSLYICCSKLCFVYLKKKKTKPVSWKTTGYIVQC